MKQRTKSLIMLYILKFLPPPQNTTLRYKILITRTIGDIQAQTIPDPKDLECTPSKYMCETTQYSDTP
jgi:hypothetical protein